MRDSDIVDGACIVRAPVVARDGVIARHGHLLGRRRAEMYRVCRRSLASEARDAISDAAQAHRLQMLIAEIAIGKGGWSLFSPRLSSRFETTSPHRRATQW